MMTVSSQQFNPMQPSYLSNVGFPLCKFRHIHWVDPMNCMKPNQCSSINKNIARMALLVGESEVAFGP